MDKNSVKNVKDESSKSDIQSTNSSKSVGAAAPSSINNKNKPITVTVENEEKKKVTITDSTKVRQYSSSEDDDDEEDEDEEDGRITTKAGKEIDRKSAGNVKRTREECEMDNEAENEFGYTTSKFLSNCCYTQLKIYSVWRRLL